jgi:type IV pilus assembly protein PilC
LLTYKYTARDATTGAKVKAVVQADNPQAAAKLIRGQGMTPLDIVPAGSGLDGLGKIFKRINTKDKILLSRQLSTLINAGLPLVQSLRTVSGQTQSKQLKVVVDQVIGDVEGGSSLADALSKHPDVFNQIYVSLVAAGETSGTLDSSLDRLATQQEKDAEVMSKVKGAMVYPIIVLVVMFAVVGFMIVKVLPQVEVLYEGVGNAELPLVTKVLLAVSHALTKYWWVAIILVVLAAIFTNKWGRSVAGKRAFDTAKMRAWPIGPLFMKLYMARFARTGATLIASGVPLIQVLEITSKAIDNVNISDTLARSIEKVKGGKALSDTLVGDRNFLPLVPDMLKIGEQSGAVETMMLKTADYYEKEVDNQIKAISTIIEPVLMVVLGVFAFIIVAAVLLPVYGLAGKTIVN